MIDLSAMCMFILSSLINSYAVFNIFNRGGGVKEVTTFKLIWWMIWEVIIYRSYSSNNINVLIIAFLLELFSCFITSFIEYKIYKKRDDFWGFFLISLLIEIALSICVSFAISQIGWLL